MTLTQSIPSLMELCGPQTLTEISHSLRRRMARGAAPSNEKFPVSKNEVIRNEISSIFLLYIRIFSLKGVHYHFFPKWVLFGSSKNGSNDFA